MKSILLWLVFLAVIVQFSIAEEQKSDLGFGQQPVLINTEIDSKTLAKRVIGSTKYMLTPGDTYELVVQIDEIERVVLILPDDYKLELPYIGTYDVRGMHFSQLRKIIIENIKSRLPVEYVDFVLSSPALFDVFIYGGVENPGIATVTPITRVTEAIAITKGIKKGASFRQIQLIRKPTTISCDLTRFVRDADLSQNPLLAPGDKIYVPHPDILVNISGKVRYPDLYEMLPGETLWDLIQLAGGTLADAEVDRLEVARIAEVGFSQRSTITLEEAKEYEVRNGDGFFVRSTGESQQMILVEGALFGEPAKAPLPRKIPEKPIVVNVPFSRGISFLQILEDFGGPTPFANAAESYVVRESGERFKVDGEKLWATRNPDHDILLEPGDHVFIPLKKLQVVVAGEVNNGGVFPYQTGMRTADYIAAAGGVDLEFGDPNRIFLVDERGKQTPINVEFEVPPGSVIYVDKRAFEYVHRGLDNTLVIVGFASAVVGLTVAILNLVDYFAE